MLATKQNHVEQKYKIVIFSFGVKCNIYFDMSERKIKKMAQPNTSMLQTARMVVNAIKDLREPGGSSVQSIKKFISNKYGNKGELFMSRIPIVIRRGISFGAIQSSGHGHYKLDSVIVLASRRFKRTRNSKKKKRRKRRQRSEC